MVDLFRKSEYQCPSVPGRSQDNIYLVVHQGLNNADDIKAKILKIREDIDLLLSGSAHLCDCAMHMQFIAERLKEVSTLTFAAHELEKKSLNIFLLAKDIADGFCKGDIVLRGDTNEHGVEFFNMTHEIVTDKLSHTGLSIYNLAPEQLQPASYREVKIVTDYFKTKNQ